MLSLYLCFAATAFSPKSFAWPVFTWAFAGFDVVFLLTFASSLGDVLDLSEGTSASTGDGFDLVFDTGGGDFAKKLKSELCFAMFCCEVDVFNRSEWIINVFFAAAQACPDRSNGFAGKRHHGTEREEAGRLTSSSENEPIGISVYHFTRPTWQIRPCFFSERLVKC